MRVRTRFAPSPTGNLHIGGIRTALYAYAQAKKHNGEFILRIEDTDRKRFVDGSIEKLVDILNKYYLAPDKLLSQKQIQRANEESKKDLSDAKWILKKDELEKVNDNDFRGIYIQSQRLPLYQKYAIELLKKGYAYACFATANELEKFKESCKKRGDKFNYRGQLGKHTIAEAIERANKGKKYVIRLDVDEYQKRTGKSILTHDNAKYPLDMVNDQILIKSDGFPTYHLAVVVDDYLMKITHAMRGWEWIPSTPKQLMIYDALGWEMQELIHLTAILNAEGKGKLSKRDGSVAAEDFLVQGYLPEAVLNFLMLLGWSSPEKRTHGEKEREFFTLNDFVELFDIKNLNNANPVFNRKKLLWFNQKYLSALKPDEFVLKFTAWVNAYFNDDEFKKQIVDKGPDYLEEVLVQIQQRVGLLSEIPGFIRPFYFEPEVKEVKKIFATFVQTKKISTDIVNKVINDFCEALKNQKDLKSWKHERWEQTVRDIAAKLDLKAGDAFMVLRIALFASPYSPPLYESMDILGKDKVLERLEILQ